MSCFQILPSSTPSLGAMSMCFQPQPSTISNPSSHTVEGPIQVWKHNLEETKTRIKYFLSRTMKPIVSMDTEFPGTIHHPTKHFTKLNPDERYHYMIKNVNDLKLIQIGLTIYNPNETLIFEFNFKNFDVTTDFHQKDSIELLKRQGIDFESNKTYGITADEFRQCLIDSGLIVIETRGYVNRRKLRAEKFSPNSRVTWVTFHGNYDYAYLVKILEVQKLQDNLEGFLDLVNYYFGKKVYDVKHMMKIYCGSCKEGLDRVAATMQVQRLRGKQHQAGSDSLLTLHTYLEMKKKLFVNIDLAIYGNMVKECLESV